MTTRQYCNWCGEEVREGNALPEHDSNGAYLNGHGPMIEVSYRIASRTQGDVHMCRGCQRKAVRQLLLGEDGE